VQLGAPAARQRRWENMHRRGPGPGFRTGAHFIRTRHGITHRDRLAALVCACGVLTASLGKMARDISLLMQHEVGEVAEPSGECRGGSSTMPQKRNPSVASRRWLGSRVPGLVATFLSSMVQEHERGVGGGQAEWSTVAAVVQATGLAAASMARSGGRPYCGRRSYARQHRRNPGTIFAERAVMMLAQKIGRNAAHKILEEATRTCSAPRSTPV